MSFEQLEQSFYTGDYTSVVTADVESLESPEERHKASLLQYRARIAQGKAKEVSAELVSSTDPALALVKVYADAVDGSSNSIEAAAKIASTSPDDNDVKLLTGLIFARGGRYEDALRILSTHENSLECTLLIVYIYLTLNRVNDAVKVVSETRKWAGDHLLYNLAEAWTCLRQGDDKAQKAFYIFDELNSTRETARSSLGQAVSQLVLRRFPEADEDLRRAREIDGTSEDVLATSVALAVIQGQPQDEFRTQVYLVSSAGIDYKEKSELFDKVAQKYASQVPS